jgi:hypothetical protein
MAAGDTDETGPGERITGSSSASALTRAGASAAVNSEAVPHRMSRQRHPFDPHRVQERQ